MERRDERHVKVEGEIPKHASKPKKKQFALEIYNEGTSESIMARWYPLNEWKEYKKYSSVTGAESAKLIKEKDRYYSGFKFRVIEL